MTQDQAKAVRERAEELSFQRFLNLTTPEQLQPELPQSEGAGAVPSDDGQASLPQPEEPVVSVLVCGSPPQQHE